MELLRRLFSRPGDRRAATPARLYLGPDVSGGLVFTGGDAWRGAVLGLPALATFAEVAALLQVDEPTLQWLAFQPNVSEIDHYHRFELEKRNGGLREIAAPKARLRAAQRLVLDGILDTVPPHGAATAYRPGSSVVAHARRHSGQAVVVRLDLREFFPSIGFPRVKGLFRGLGYNDGVSTVLALLTVTAREGAAFDELALPQGACTSPAIANLICRRLDARLSGLAAAHGFAFGRYADDLTFSHPADDAPLGRLLTSVAAIVADEGFAPEPSKTRVMRRHQRQVVTGLTVNDDVAVPRADLRRFRAFLHRCERDGLEQTTRRLGKDARAHAQGYLAWVAMVEPEKARRLREAHPWIG